MKINFRALIKISGMLAFIEGMAMLPCGAAGLYFKDRTSFLAFTVCGVLCIVLGLLGFLSQRSLRVVLRLHEGYLIACVCWVLGSVLGALPILTCGMKYPLIGAFFESVAGFTTTGCTVFDVAAMPRALILWRSILNWLGGMGILVLVVSIFPALGISGQSLAAVEANGPSLQKIGGRATNTGKFLYLTYISFTILEFLLLCFTDMGIFYAMINTFSNISTGGLFLTPATEPVLQGGYVKVVITVFTILSSLNYTLYYYVLNGRLGIAVKNFECRVFLIIIGSATVMITAGMIISRGTSPLKALGSSLFNVVSFISTAGYVVEDSSSLPGFVIFILITLLFIGGCSMSTAGSLKVVRIITMFKLIRRGVFKLIHPHSVKAVTMENSAMTSKRVSEITTHLLLFFVVLIMGSLALGLNNLPMGETLTAAIGAVTNTGLLLDSSGFTGCFSDFNGFSQLIICFLMLAGRLEMYALIIVFTRSFRQLDKNTRL